jgi:hypothetical protein
MFNGIVEYYATKNVSGYYSSHCTSIYLITHWFLISFKVYDHMLFISELPTKNQQKDCTV